MNKKSAKRTDTENERGKRWDWKDAKRKTNQINRMSTKNYVNSIYVWIKNAKKKRKENLHFWLWFGLVVCFWFGFGGGGVVCGVWWCYFFSVFRCVMCFVHAFLILFSIFFFNFSFEVRVVIWVKRLVFPCSDYSCGNKIKTKKEN